MSEDENLNLLFESLNINEKEDKIELEKDNVENSFYKLPLKERICKKIDNGKDIKKPKKRKVIYPKDVNKEGKKKLFKFKSKGKRMEIVEYSKFY